MKKRENCDNMDSKEFKPCTTHSRPHDQKAMLKVYAWKNDLIDIATCLYALRKAIPDTKEGRMAAALYQEFKRILR